MQLDSEIVHKIAHLARLKVEEKDTPLLISEMNAMLTFVEKLQELDTEEIEPLVHLSNEENIMREDTPQTVFDKKDALSNAPKHDGEYFRVPKIINQT